VERDELRVDIIKELRVRGIGISARTSRIAAQRADSQARVPYSHEQLSW